MNRFYVFISKNSFTSKRQLLKRKPWYLAHFLSMGFVRIRHSSHHLPPSPVQGSSQRSQGVAGRYALTVDVPVPLPLLKCRYAFDVFIVLVFSSGRESIASESQVHKTRRARLGRCVFLFFYFRIRRLPSSAPHRDCSVGPCHVNVKPKFTEEESSLKIHTPVERLGKTFNDGPIHQNLPCSELGRMRFVPWHRRSMARSLFPSDVSAPRRIDDKLCYLFYLSLYVDFNKIAKRKTRKREWTVLALWHRRACAFSRDRRLALHVCYQHVQRRQKRSAQACLADFFEFWFRLADERLCNWWCKEEMRALFFWATSAKVRCSIRAHRFDFSQGATSQGVTGSVTGSTGVDVNNRFCHWKSFFS